MMVKDPTFKSLTNSQLVARINRAADFGYDDEEAELVKRIQASNGRYKLHMNYNTLELITLRDD